MEPSGPPYGGTLDALVSHLSRTGHNAKVAVWEHNSHLGDARATDMGWRGELNVGQLVREKYGQEAILIGFTTHHGTVTAASDWGDPAERKSVRPALTGSYEALFHATGRARFLLILNDSDTVAEQLCNPRLERAIGVIYRPETERQSHHFYARLSDQFDAVLHFDETRAVEPLETTAEWEAGEVPETFPFAVRSRYRRKHQQRMTRRAPSQLALWLKVTLARDPFNRGAHK